MPPLLIHELLDYWLQHPDAAGTEQAIAEWWLLEHSIRRSISLVRPVLAELVEKGYVAERRRPDGRVCYRLNKSMEAEAREWLRRTAASA